MWVERNIEINERHSQVHWNDEGILNEAAAIVIHQNTIELEWVSVYMYYIIAAGTFAPAENENGGNWEKSENNSRIILLKYMSFEIYSTRRNKQHEDSQASKQTKQGVGRARGAYTKYAPVRFLSLLRIG